MTSDTKSYVKDEVITTTDDLRVGTFQYINDKGKSLGEAFLRVRGRVKDGSARSSELSFEDLPRNTLKM